MVERGPSRRLFLGGLFAVFNAVVMPVAAGATPRIVGDGIHDDTDGLNALLAGRPVAAGPTVLRDGDSVQLLDGVYRVTRPIDIERSHVNLDGGTIKADPDLFRGGALLNFRGTDIKVSNTTLIRQMNLAEHDGDLVRFWPSHEVPKLVLEMR